MLMSQNAAAIPHTTAPIRQPYLMWIPVLIPSASQPIDKLPDFQILLDVNGALEPGDLVVYQDGSLYDEYELEGVAGQQVDIYLESPDFDPYLVLIDPGGNILAQNDDENPDTHNASLSIVLPMDGTYRVVANGFDRYSQGDYRLTVQTPSLAELGNQPLTGASE